MNTVLNLQYWDLDLIGGLLYPPPREPRGHDFVGFFTLIIKKYFFGELNILKLILNIFKYGLILIKIQNILNKFSSRSK